jgi:YVTN family beta-propeller protein
VQFAVSPDGRWLVGTGELSSKFLVFDLSDPDAPRLARELAVGAAPWHPSFTPDGSEVWFGNKDANTVTVIDAETWTVKDVLSDPSFNEPHGSAVAPDGDEVFVSSRNVRAPDAEGAPTDHAAVTGTERPGRVTVIDVRSRAVKRVLDVGAYAAGVAAPGPAR